MSGASTISSGNCIKLVCKKHAGDCCTYTFTDKCLTLKPQMQHSFCLSLGKGFYYSALNMRALPLSLRQKKILFLMETAGVYIVCTPKGHGITSVMLSC